MRVVIRPMFVALLISLSPTQANTQTCWNWDKMVLSDRYEDEDVFRCLRVGADPNARDNDGWTPLHFAAHFTASPAVVVALLDAGADPNARNDDGWTPLHQAALNNTNPDITAALLRAGADPTAKTRAAGLTPIYIANDTGKLVIAAMLEAAMDSGANVRSGLGASRDFGDDSGEYANDGECDDTRFVGDRGGGAVDTDSHIRRDATDCRNLLRAGRISWGTSAGRNTNSGLSGSGDGGGDFGDDSGAYSNDGECDDTRFVGDRGGGAADNDSHIRRDATDCRSLLRTGRISWGTSAGRNTNSGLSGSGDGGGDFGDDSGAYSNDGECDDTRFIGNRGGGAADNDSHIRRDATDCRNLLRAGRISWGTSAGGSANSDAGVVAQGAQPTQTGSPVAFTDPTSGYVFAPGYSWMLAACGKPGANGVYVDNYYLSELFSWAGTRVHSNNLEEKFRRQLERDYSVTRCLYVNHIPHSSDWTREYAQNAWEIRLQELSDIVRNPRESTELVRVRNFACCTP